jgi:hypothetical protein
LIFLPSLILPVHPEEYVVVYPERPDADTLYVPGFSVTVVPEDEPGNVAGEGLLPETFMVKSEGLLLPPNTLEVTSSVPNEPGGVGRLLSLWIGMGMGAGVGRLLSLWIVVFVFAP